ncbi:unnamed protein product [Brachionus calyciflorus]|uniref:sphinganine-1-phosphate aldolase n=1 Tax=Brachionus calyciflorus TaxID=104777 RepID=A0A813LZB8_9BILA|nr:unnamed protein product [Brachionus calyciflorus]
MKEFLLSRLGHDNTLLNEIFNKIDPITQQILTRLDRYERWELVVISVLMTYVGMRFRYFLLDLDKGLWDYMKKQVFKLSKKLPFLNAKIMSELDKTKHGLEEDILKSNKGELFVQKLPSLGLGIDKTLETIEQKYVKLNDLNWKNGAVSGCVYGADDNLTLLTTKVYEKFAWSNPMHADVFPDVRKMEAEVVRMVCNLFHGDEDSCGTMTTGGTESIMLACKAYRELAYSKGIQRPEMVVPVTAHAAFDKAANFFRIKIHHVPVDPITKKVNPKVLKSYINSNTCMIAGSAPNFPHGSIDPIEQLSKIACDYKIPLHVDACLGGFLIAFMQDAGFKLPLFDFRLPGVTSISCDTHKYGYTPKGSSVIMYRSTEYRKNQYFSAVEWPGGIYVSPTFAGSRAGSLIAMTWATLMSIGHEGYVKITKDIIDTTRYITKAVEEIKELKLMARPDVSVVAFESSEFNIFRLLDDMTSKGWHLNALQNPSGVHIAVTKLHTLPGVAERFVNDLKSAVKDIMSKDDRQLGKVAAIYCSTQSIPDKSIIADVAYLFLDACYNTKDKPIANGSGKH